MATKEKTKDALQSSEYASPVIEMVEVVCERGFASSPAEGEGEDPTGTGSNMPWG